MLLLFAFVFRNQFYLMAFVVVVDDDVVFFRMFLQKKSFPIITIYYKESFNCFQLMSFCSAIFPRDKLSLVMYEQLGLYPVPTHW